MIKNSLQGLGQRFQLFIRDETFDALDQVFQQLLRRTSTRQSLLLDLTVFVHACCSRNVVVNKVFKKFIEISWNFVLNDEHSQRSNVGTTFTSILAYSARDFKRCKGKEKLKKKLKLVIAE